MDIKQQRPWKLWLNRALYFIPSFKNRSLLVRVGITALLVGLLVALGSVKFDQNFSLLVAAMRYNPVDHAKRLNDDGKKKDALDFIVFYQSILAGDDNLELKALAAQIEQDRSSWAYRSDQVWKGVKGEGSEEWYSEGVELVTEFTAIGDIRTLLKEYDTKKAGGEVDQLNVGLSALGLGLTLASIGPQSTAVAPFKYGAMVLKKSSNVMTTVMKKSLVQALTPLEKFFDSVVRPLVSKADFLTNKSAIANVSDEAAKVVTTIGVRFSDFIALAKINPKVAVAVARHSDDVASLSKNAKLAVNMGDEAAVIISNGGKKSLEAAEALQKQEKLSGGALKSAMQFGESGLEWIRKMPLESLARKIRLARTTLSGKLLYYLRYAISLIPLPVALLFMAGSVLVLFKMWIFRMLGTAS